MRQVEKSRKIMSMNIILKYGLAYRFVIVIYFMLPIKYIYIYIYIYIYNVDNHLHWGRC